MFDIHFFKNSFELKNRILRREFSQSEIGLLFRLFESMRSKRPNVFNVETTNNCNMTCVMCPRTKLMTRGISNLDQKHFERILDQISAHSASDLQNFETFITSQGQEDLQTPSENSFFFKLVSKCLLLHGYGEPLLDKLLLERVKYASQRSIPTYFSCVPANLTLPKAIALMEAGLTVLKVSIDSLDDFSQKKIRGQKNNFSSSYETVLQVLEAKKQGGFSTIIAPTMIQLSNSCEAKEMAKQFLKLWEGKDVFAYVKSQDNRWYYEESNEIENHSHHAKQYCEFPWISMSVSAEGIAVPCTQDYNTEIRLGDTKTQSLDEIWNGNEYEKLRIYHLSGEFPVGHKCAERCDQRKIGQLLKQQKPTLKNSNKPHIHLEK